MEKEQKQLADMTLSELWQLFPIVLSEHDSRWATYFSEESRALRHAFGLSVVRISHIGSTAVPGLVAKPTVDILIELSNEIGINETSSRLTGEGWIRMYGTDDEPLHLGFNKGYTPSGYAQRVFHLHVRRPGDPDELYFRDYLLEHPQLCRDYASVKRDLRRRFEHDRDGYTKAKTPLIREITARARRLYGPRYRLPASGNTAPTS